MRLAVLAAVLLAGSASAQTPVPPPPVPPPPVMAPGAQSVTAPPAVPETWLPLGSADLVGLDKITTRLTKFSVKLGETVSFGTLRITLRGCAVRGPNQPADQAAFLDIADARRKDFAFHSWMLLSAPAVAVVEHPVYDVKLAGCR
ncbi:MAG: DUF2155 domain-containing protein [Acetobacteraceae bacterium]|nr:DUF2155 domain-containing protein [Acetobacteraceae bacterium]